MFSESLLKQAAKVLDDCRTRKLKLATAESCTGGLIAALLTEIPGSSDVFEGGFVTYANHVKEKQLGVNAAVLASHGAVSAEVAQAMATGARRQSESDIAVSATGIAGPGGGTARKPVGLVFIAVASSDAVKVQEYRFTGNRQQVRLQAVEAALAMIQGMLR